MVQALGSYHLCQRLDLSPSSALANIWGASLPLCLSLTCKPQDLITSSVTWILRLCPLSSVIKISLRFRLLAGYG